MHVRHLTRCAQMMKESNVTGAARKAWSEGPSLKDFISLGAESSNELSNSVTQAASFVPYVKEQDCYGNDRRGNSHSIIC